MRSLEARFFAPLNMLPFFPPSTSGPQARSAIVSTFFGPPEKGVYSASVQRTLFLMGAAALRAAPALSSITLSAPNLHFLPINLPALGLPFANDV